MVKRSFTLKIDGKEYQVEIPRPGVIAVNGNVFDVEITANGVSVDGKEFNASLSEDFAVVGGRLYETEWQV